MEYVLKNRFYCFNFLILFLGCSSTKSNICQAKLPSGIYSTVKLSKLEKLDYSLKYDSDFFHFYEMGIKLQDDSTFYVVFCNRKMASIGNWHTNDKDTVYLTNITRLSDKKKIPDMKHFYNQGMIFFSYNSHKLRHTTLLKIGGEIFDGITSDTAINVKDTLSHLNQLPN